MVELKDHLEVVAILAGALLILAGLSGVLIYIDQSVLVAPVIGGCVLAAILGEGAYAEWSLAKEQARSFVTGEPLRIDRADTTTKGGTAFARLYVANPNDTSVSDCYVRLVSSEVGSGHPAYGGPEPGYHFSWSSYEGVTGQTTTIGRHSEAVLDVAFSQDEGAKCFIPW